MAHVELTKGSEPNGIPYPQHIVEGLVDVSLSGLEKKEVITILRDVEKNFDSLGSGDIATTESGFRFYKFKDALCIERPDGSTWYTVGDLKNGGGTFYQQGVASYLEDVSVSIDKTKTIAARQEDNWNSAQFSVPRDVGQISASVTDRALTHLRNLLLGKSS